MAAGAIPGLDWPQVAVAAVATASYAATSIVLRRVVDRRRRRQAWRDARFVSQLIERAGDGSLQTVPDVAALYREGGAFDGKHHRLERLIDRARMRVQRREARSRARRRGDLNPRRHHAGVRLEQLAASCRAASMEDVIQNARVAAEDLERIRLDAQRQVRDAVRSSEPPGERRKRRARQRRTASMIWRGLVGAGCIAFVQIVLVVWHSLR